MSEIQYSANISRRTFASAAAAAIATSALAFGAMPAMAEEADAVSGASQVVNPETQLSQEDIKALILDYLKGFVNGKDENGEDVWSYREMYAIATCQNNHPGLSTVEFILEPETMTFVCSSEKGTEKCVQLAENPECVLYWYHQLPAEEIVAGQNDYFNSYGVQVKGTAEFLTPETPGAMEAASHYMETLRGYDAWNAMSQEDKDATCQMLFGYNDWIRVNPTQIIVNSLNWRYNTEESRRPEWYDPESPYFGMEVRQEYYM